MSVGEVGDEFRRVLDRFARTRDQIAQVTAALVGLQGRLLATSRGGQHPLLGRALAQLQQAIQRLSEAAAANTEASEAVRGYLTHIGVGAGSEGSPIAEAPATAADRSARSRLDDQIKQAANRSLLAYVVPTRMASG
nr:hypothetical protein [Micromonospora sp. DSM 115978]